MFFVFRRDCLFFLCWTDQFFCLFFSALLSSSSLLSPSSLVVVSSLVASGLVPQALPLSHCSTLLYFTSICLLPTQLSRLVLSSLSHIPLASTIIVSTCLHHNTPTYINIFNNEVTMADKSGKWNNPVLLESLVMAFHGLAKSADGLTKESKGAVVAKAHLWGFTDITWEGIRYLRSCLALCFALLCFYLSPTFISPASLTHLLLSQLPLLSIPPTHHLARLRLPSSQDYSKSPRCLATLCDGPQRSINKFSSRSSRPSTRPRSNTILYCRTSSRVATISQSQL